MPTQELLTIRPARPDDLDMLVKFSAAMALETEGRTLDVDRLRRGTAAVLESPSHGFYLVAEIPAVAPRSQQVVGQLLITYEWSDWRNATFWWIQSVYVDPAWRRRGVYRRMHESVIEQARARRDVCGVRLYVERDNKVAQGTYLEVGLNKASYDVYEDDFILKRVRSEG
jgi:ribosomal protein S18 acetylase RimI-like enzyme